MLDEDFLAEMRAKTDQREREEVYTALQYGLSADALCVLFVRNWLHKSHVL